MYLTKTINIPIYDCKVQFIVTKDAKKFVNNLHKKHNIKQKYTDNIAGIMFTMDMGIYRIIVDERYLSVNVVMHEVLHCVMAVTSDRLLLEEENRCWLMGDLSQQIFDFLKSKQIEL